MKGVLLRLSPFLISTALYFILWDWVQEPSIFASILRSIPTISLAIFVASQSFTTGIRTQYSHKLLEGLLFSVVADVLVVWPQLVIPAIFAFGACFIAYTSAFGFNPLQPQILAFVAALGIQIYYVVLLPCLKGIYLLIMPVYLGLLGIMLWRALSLPKQLLSASVGTLIFAVSDLFDDVATFCSNVPNFRFLIMSTYYAAQGLIAFFGDRSVRPSKGELSLGMGLLY